MLNLCCCCSSLLVVVFLSVYICCYCCFNCCRCCCCVVVALLLCCRYYKGYMCCYCCCYNCCFCCSYDCYLLLLFCSLFVVVVFYDVMLLSRLKTREKSKRGGGSKKWNKFRSISKGAIMFPNVKIMVTLFSFFSDVSMCASSKHYKDRGFSQCWPLFCLLFGCKKYGQ